MALLHRFRIEGIRAWDGQAWRMPGDVVLTLAPHQGLYTLLEAVFESRSTYDDILSHLWQARLGTVFSSCVVPPATLPIAPPADRDARPHHGCSRVGM